MRGNILNLLSKVFLQDSNREYLISYCLYYVLKDKRSEKICYKGGIPKFLFLTFLKPGSSTLKMYNVNKFLNLLTLNMSNGISVSYQLDHSISDLRSLPSFLLLLGGTFHFNRAFCKQTVDTLVRRRISHEKDARLIYGLKRL